MGSTDAAALSDELAKLHSLKVHTADEPGEFKGKEGSHVPQVTLSEGKAKVEVKHEMRPEHWIKFIWVQDESGAVLGASKLTSEDVAVLHVELPEGTKEITAFECCNIHGLWKTALIPIPSSSAA